MPIRSIEKEDGPWWYLCQECKYDTGYFGNPRVKSLGSITPEDRKARICPKLQIEYDVLCGRCDTKMILQRCEITVNIP